MSSPQASDRPFNPKAQASWLRWEAQTDLQLDPFGRAAMEALAIRPGERVLDVGCGCGQTLLELAPLCGPAGRVVGVDPSGPMLARAGERVSAAGLTNVETVVADAAVHPFAPGAFDALYSRFGVMFFDDPRAAFAHLRGALAPGGRLAFVCWQRFERNPWSSRPLEAVQRALGERAVTPPMLQPGAPGPFGFADGDRVREILRDAGFEQIQVRPFEMSMHFGAATTLEDAVTFALEIGPAARMAAERSPAERARCVEELRAALKPFLGPRGVWFDAAAFVVTARRP
jgi:ubiquinone/menaquinone biosynthesis C-methylase UbiE